ncbi:ATP-binding protein [Gloeothece verrucosa]|uniref:ORC1/DEAH AAA+ ATPase domain-containing protein n=1 Tax=Gloeothece verrucosa (strain PCC 7822) TaxID=497965 RepID=E0UMY2_GLOV7|nr:ATP-binding protein [Gloeothece verrucosa]ADN18312.1 conserved hypothetical protein [Gloeothece verrucosa PCC 7822]
MTKNNLAQKKSVPSKSPKVNDLVHSCEELQRRTPAQQTEIEPIGKADTYCYLDRDDELFTWLNDQRDLKLCGYIVATKGSGLPKSCEYYRLAHVKRRGSLFEIPATVFYLEMLQKGKATDLYQAILSEFGHPLPTLGKLNNLRSRTWDNLKRYGVKILIVGKADYLKLEAFNELIDLYEHLRISVVLAGTHYLEDILGRNHSAYVRVSNSFLEWYEFPSLTSEDVVTVVEDWEKKFLTPKNRLNLTQSPEVVETLKEKSGGLIESLYDLLRQIAMFSTDDPYFELTPSNIMAYLSHRKPPTQKLG